MFTTEVSKGDFTSVDGLAALDDEKLVRLIREGEDHALDFIIRKYKGLVHMKARTYFLIGADKEDIIQEGMIGLFKAIRDYDGRKLASFKAFADICVTRHIITAVKTATRKKHLPLNSYVSLDKPMFDEDSDRTLMDIVADYPAIDPQELLVDREKEGDINHRLSASLSSLEMEVLHLYIDGCTYQEISNVLGRHEKSIDNALQRIKRKLERLIFFPRETRVSGY